MKKTHIIGIIVIVIAIAAIISSISDSSTYANFEEAFAHPEQEYHVVGTLDRTASITYNPSVNPNLTRFTMVDKQGVKSEVYLNKSKPQDFERSESVVIIGKAKNDAFYANDILMKCPSKYDEDNQLDTASK